MKLLAASVLLACACAAHAQDDGPRVDDAPAIKEVGRGLASWYGQRFHGRRTASGERFDMNELTAAHRSLPFGTIVKVRSLVNGREIEVRINDRGPHIKKRVIDLSRAAAQKLGLLDSGLGTKPVAITLVPVQKVMEEN